MSRAARSISGTKCLGVMLLAALAPYAAGAQDASCKQVFNGIKLQAKTPNHQYFTISGAQPDSQALTNEVVHTGTARFDWVNGTWQSVPESPRDVLKREEQNFKNSRAVCRLLRDEMVDGVATAVYMEQSQTGSISSVGTIWIAKNSGLPVHEQFNIDAGTGPAGQRRIDIRIVYKDVHAPVIVK